MKFPILTYFNLPGRGEATRLALAIGQIEFTDQRIPFPEWKDYKPTTTWGSLPVFTYSLDEKDGTTTTRKIAQQRAVLRFVGRETGLYPTGSSEEDSFKAAKIDELMDALEDVGAKTNAVGQGLEKAAKEAERAKAVEVGGVTYGILTKVDEYIATNGSQGYAVGDSLTIADLLVYTTCSGLVSGLFDGVPPNALDPFNHINACRKLVRSHPAVVKWYDGLDVEIKVPTSFHAL